MTANKNPIAWITGASSGIGEALACRMARQGYRVAASARSAEKLQALSAVNFGAGRIAPYPLDVTDHAAMQAAIEKIIRDEGRIDLAVLNAGTYIPETGLDFDVNSIRQQFNLNVISVMDCLSILLPAMKRQGGGHIAIMASVAGYCGLPQAIGYGGTKAALINMTEAMRLDCAKAGIKLQMICPGFVKTPLTDQNRFPMPFLIDVDKAAGFIVEGLQSSRFEIVFPPSMAVAMKILRHLPYALYFPLVRKLTGAGK